MADNAEAMTKTEFWKWVDKLPQDELDACYQEYGHLKPDSAPGDQNGRDKH